MKHIKLNIFAFLLLIFILLVNFLFTPISQLGSSYKEIPYPQSSLINSDSFLEYSSRNNNMIDATWDHYAFNFGYFARTETGSGYKGKSILNLSIQWDFNALEVVPIQQSCTGNKVCLSNLTSSLILEPPTSYGKHLLTMHIIDEDLFTSTFIVEFFIYFFLLDPFLMSLLLLIIISIIFGIFKSYKAKSIKIDDYVIFFLFVGSFIFHVGFTYFYSECCPFRFQFLDVLLFTLQGIFLLFSGVIFLFSNNIISKSQSLNSQSSINSKMRESRQKKRRLDLLSRSPRFLNYIPHKRPLYTKITILSLLLISLRLLIILNFRLQNNRIIFQVRDPFHLNKILFFSYSIIVILILIRNLSFKWILVGIFDLLLEVFYIFGIFSKFLDFERTSKSKIRKKNQINYNRLFILDQE